MKLKFALSFLLAGLSVPMLFADENDKGPTPPTPPGTGNTPNWPIPVPVLPGPINPGNKPQSPEGQYIQCLYDGDNLNFWFAIPEGNCNLTVVDTDKGAVTWHFFDSSSESQIYVGTLWNAAISIDTEKGNTYEGFLISE